MKQVSFKYIYLAICGALLLASCEDNTKAIQAQARQIDSTVNARARQHDLENAKKTDSTLKAIEVHKADSIAALQQKSATPPPAAATAASVTPAPAPKAH